MSFHIKILIPRSKSSVEVHQFVPIFHAGESILGGLRYLISMAKIESALI